MKRLALDRAGDGRSGGRADTGPEYRDPAGAVVPADRPPTAPAVAVLPVACLCGRVAVLVSQADVRRGTFDPPTCPRCP